jgi:DivIVA domain-containing protein
MSATNLDLPVLISAEQIRRREFVTIRRGYDPDQVRAYLEQLADQTELMRVLLRDAQVEAETAIRTISQPRQDPYQQLGERVASVIREADHVADAIRGEARRDAEQVTREARADADRIRTDAQSKGEEARARADAAVRAAREEADRTIAGLATRRDALFDQLASMQERLIGVAHDLESAMDLKVSLPDIASIRDLLDGSEERDGSIVNEAAAPHEMEKPDVLDASDAPADPAGAPIEGVDPIGPREKTVAVREAGDEDDDDERNILDLSYEELWDGTDAVKLDLPEIPALDLDWGEADGDEDHPDA